jgi:two-component sensor histidine kinase
VDPEKANEEDSYFCRVNPGSKRHGLGLVGRLAEQVAGTASVAADKGAVWTISFPLNDRPGENADISATV